MTAKRGEIKPGRKPQVVVTVIGTKRRHTIFRQAGLNQRPKTIYRDTGRGFSQPERKT